MRSIREYLRSQPSRRQFQDFFRPLRLETLEDRALLTITPQLVTDINPLISTVIHPAGAIVEMDGVAFFEANDGVNGFELWKSDGTPAGTVLVKDIFAGADSSFPVQLTNVNGTLFFNAYDGIHGTELWKSDGTTGGTTLVKDIRAGSPSSAPGLFTNVSGTVFFVANDGVNGYELWKSDGTAIGTTLVKDISAGGGSLPQYLRNVNGTLFFSADDGINGRELWKSDGTSAGTMLVKDIRAGAGMSYLARFTNVNGTLFFQANDGTTGIELWKSDGTSAGTTLVKDIRAGAGTSAPDRLTNVNGTLFFRAYDATNDLELWKSDGTGAGTTLVKDINPGAARSYPDYLTNVNGTLFFSANDGVNGVELWKSDGTNAGTALVKDIRAGSGSDPHFLTNMNGTLFFRANDGVNGLGLWKSDGASGGTTLVKNIDAGGGGYAVKLVNVNGTLFFGASDATNKSELWISDGTTGGTVTLSRRTASSSPGAATMLGGSAFFAANDGTSGYELWKSDGTTAGTTLVKDINPGAAPSDVRFLTNVNGTLFFSANDGVNGVELWKSDGTPTGTMLVKDFFSPGDGLPFYLTNVNGTLLFTAYEGAHGSELWKSDGTAAGTVLVKDIRGGATGSYARSLVNVNGTLFFSANDGTNGYELWKSNGTDAGTTLVKDINTGGSSYVAYLTNVNGTLFFTADDGANGRELWTSDGTAAGTTLVKDINMGGGSNPRYLTSVNGTLFFRTDGVNGNELWKSDGTSTGTVPIKTFATIGSFFGSGTSLANVNGTLFFTAFDAAHGFSELWKSDGTYSGTTLVKDINAEGGSYATRFANVNGTLFFTALDAAHGFELWKSDGSDAGTVLIGDLAPGPGWSYPVNLQYLSGRLIFTADDGAHGRELWSAVLYDFGDAAASYGTAFHLNLGPQLGPLRDEEPDGAPSASANTDTGDDGLVNYSLMRGKSSSVTLNVVTDGDNARIDGWVDWDHSGTFTADEKIIHSRAVAPGQTTIFFDLSSQALVGPATARFRISTAGDLGPTGLAQDGEVEDYVLTIAQDLAVNLPPGNGTNTILIHENGSNVEVLDFNTSTVLATSPLAYTNSLTVNGSATGANQLSVDYLSGGFFSLPGGVQLNGRASGGDSLTVIGGTTSQYISRGLALGNAAIETQESELSNEIRFTNFSSVSTIGAAFEVVGVLNVGDLETLDVSSYMPLKLGRLTNLLGGTINAGAGGVALGNGDTLHGWGTVNARVAADIGSLINATDSLDTTGPLTLGDSSSPAGFVTRGELRVGPYGAVTLLDANQAVLGSLTTLGFTGNNAGFLNAANGILVDFGNNIVGFGTINTPNDVLKPLTNNGSIAGISATEKIALPGYVKGVGTLNNVNITGTNSPGFSPATVYYGSTSYGATGKLVAEIGGNTPGSDYDQQLYSGTADLGGTLDIELLNGFAPSLGDTFALISAAGGVHGMFTAQTNAPLPEFWFWQLAYGPNDLKATLVSSRPWHNSLKKLDVVGTTGLSPDGRVLPADALAVINYINASFPTQVPAVGVTFALGKISTYGGPLGYLDTNGDGNVTASDALDVINVINAGLGGEGEGVDAIEATLDGLVVPDNLLALLAIDSAAQLKRHV